MAQMVSCERVYSVTLSLGKSSGLKSFGEQPHQSTMCLYWQRHPSFLFQLVSLRLLFTNVLHCGLFLRTVWKNDYKKKERAHSILKLPLLKKMFKDAKQSLWLLVLIQQSSPMVYCITNRGGIRTKSPQDKILTLVKVHFNLGYFTST